MSALSACRASPPQKPRPTVGHVSEHLSGMRPGFRPGGDHKRPQLRTGLPLRRAATLVVLGSGRAQPISPPAGAPKDGRNPRLAPAPTGQRRRPTAHPSIPAFSPTQSPYEKRGRQGLGDGLRAGQRQRLRAIYRRHHQPLQRHAAASGFARAL